MELKCLSIITNFGCHYKCPYCIVKKNGINVPKTTVESLDTLLETYKSGKYNYISLSDGGDPMFEFDKHMDFYNKLFSICRENNIKIELHTSYIKEIENKLPFELFKRIVFHCNTIDDIFEAEQTDCKGVNKRVVFVVEDRMNINYILTVRDIINSSKTIDQLSFRQRVDENYNVSYHLHDFLYIGHLYKQWYYIEQGDYNTYFVDGQVKEKYSDLRK
jgi:organic radical activating enzyme